MPYYRAGVRKRPPTHPGQVVETILRDIRMSGREAARRLGVTNLALSKVTWERRR
jgi:plasmid maintenance system antidote protein VapI